VVVGGGAAGLELATGLGDKLARKGRVRVTLVDRSRTHLWKPLLHEVAAGSMDPGEHELNLLAQAHWHGFSYRLGEMIGLDRAKKQVLLGPVIDDEGREISAASTLTYDTLVIAVGSVTNDFGTPGVAEHAVPLETPEQAVRFNRRLVNACLRAQAQPGPILPGQLHVAIIGAGATGSELAAELHHTARQVVAFGMDRIDPRADIRIILIEAAPRILPGLPERISRTAAGMLEKLGVDVRVGRPVAEVTVEGVRMTGGEFLPAELVVWAAGVRGPAFLKDLDGLETNRNIQIAVTPTLQSTRDPDVFAIGDCAACPRPGHDTPVPPRAQAAHQQSSHLIRQFARRLEGKPLQPFVYHDLGSLVSLGEYSTVGSLMGFLTGRALFIEGAFAGLMYRSLYSMHEYALHGARRVITTMLARILAKRVYPKVKLH
jgi:NADH dehydrogenase